MGGERLLDELGRFDGDAEILQSWRDGMAPEPALLVSEWADRHRVLSSRGSAEPGPWRTTRTPYLKEVMDALSPSHPAQRGCDSRCRSCDIHVPSRAAMLPISERAQKTPIWTEVADAYDATKERVQIREHTVDVSLRKLK
jgi:hypothetical protein